MTNEEKLARLENSERKLCEILALPIDKQPKELQEWGREIDVNLIGTPRTIDQQSTIHTVQVAHSFLQRR